LCRQIAGPLRVCRMAERICWLCWPRTRRSRREVTMKARRFRSFLVAVRDIDRPPRALLGKAVRLAQRFRGRLELLHVIALPYVLPGAVGGDANAKEAEITRQQDKLEHVAARLRKLGVKVDATI